MTKFWAACFAIAAVTSHFLSEKMYSKAQTVMDILRDRGPSDDLTILNATLASYRATDVGTVFEYLAVGFACMSIVGVTFMAIDIVSDHFQSNHKRSNALHAAQSHRPEQ